VPQHQVSRESSLWRSKIRCCPLLPGMPFSAHIIQIVLAYIRRLVVAVMILQAGHTPLQTSRPARQQPGPPLTARSAAARQEQLCRPMLEVPFAALARKTALEGPMVVHCCQRRELELIFRMPSLRSFPLVVYVNGCQKKTGFECRDRKLASHRSLSFWQLICGELCGHLGRHVGHVYCQRRIFPPLRSHFSCGEVPSRPPRIICGERLVD